jgi:hypothetical protein
MPEVVATANTGENMKFKIGDKIKLTGSRLAKFIFFNQIVRITRIDSSPYPYYFIWNGSEYHANASEITSVTAAIDWQSEKI